MNNKFNENEVRIDCNGNVIDKPFLYDCNKTMKLLGKTKLFLVINTRT